MPGREVTARSVENSAGASLRLARFLGSMSAERIPQSARDAALRVSLHVLGMGVLGTSLPLTAATARFAVASELGTCSIFNRAETVTAGAAALVNATACHEDFREDAHSGSQSHPLAAILPASLALAEARGGARSGATFLEAVVRGVEATARMGDAGAVHSTPRGFRASSIYPLFGATAAAGHIVGLTDIETGHAFALAAQMASGLAQPFHDGTEEWFLAPGFAARSAVTAVLLAAEGIETAPRILEGEHGFFAAFAGLAAGAPETTEVAADHVYEIERLRLKPELTCGWNQSVVYLLKHTARLDANRVRSVRVALSDAGAHYPGVASQGPFTNRTSALLSCPFAVALLLRDGRLAPAGFHDVNDPALLELARRVEVEVDPAYDGYSTRIEVTFADGSTAVAQHLETDPPHSLLSLDEVEANLRRAFRDAGSDEGRVAEVLRGLELMFATGDPGDLGRALSGRPLR